VWRGTPASAAGSGKQRHDAHPWVAPDVGSYGCVVAMM